MDPRGSKTGREEDGGDEQEEDGGDEDMQMEKIPKNPDLYPPPQPVRPDPKRR